MLDNTSQCADSNMIIHGLPSGSLLFGAVR